MKKVTRGSCSFNIHYCAAVPSLKCFFDKRGFRPGWDANRHHPQHPVIFP